MTFRVRLALVNTAEKEETKYTESKEFVKSVCGIGTKLWLMRMTGNQTEVITEWLALFIVGVRENKTSSLNQQLLQNDYAKILEQYFGGSEF